MTKISNIEVLDIIERYMALNGRSPTYRDIAEALDRSVVVVHGHIKRLEKLGYITRIPSSARSLQLGPVRRHEIACPHCGKPLFKSERSNDGNGHIEADGEARA